MPKFKVRLHCNLTCYKPVMEFDVHRSVADHMLPELYRELEEGSLTTLEVEGPEGIYRFKRRVV